jgi:hypothetical protein
VLISVDVVLIGVWLRGEGIRLVGRVLMMKRRLGQDRVRRELPERRRRPTLGRERPLGWSRRLLRVCRGRCG